MIYINKNNELCHSFLGTQWRRHKYTFKYKMPNGKWAYVYKDGVDISGRDDTYYDMFGITMLNGKLSLSSPTLYVDTADNTTSYDDLRKKYGKNVVVKDLSGKVLSEYDLNTSAVYKLFKEKCKQYLNIGKNYINDLLKRG